MALFIKSESSGNSTIFYFVDDVVWGSMFRLGKALEWLKFPKILLQTKVMSLFCQNCLNTILILVL